MALVRLCGAAEVPVDSVKAIGIGDRTLAVYNIGGCFYATDDECTHGAASLAMGMLDGDHIECAAHFGSFHVPSGRAVAPPCDVDLRTYKVAVEGENLYVDLDQPADAAI
jgi:nitrite reductase/ring-hydroxylating ferredoxin subunit